MIHIAHLYYNLLNLYGESGNVKALKKELENQGLKVSVHFLTIDDELDLEKYDFVYIGAGTEANQKLIIPHLNKYKDIIKKEIEQGKFYFITGNAINLFGKYILDENENKIETLGIFDFYSKQESFRMVDESVMKCNFLSKPVIGFQNQSTVIKDNKYPMFEVIKGIGSYPKSINEGIKYKNFYGTYLIGPVLVRNPELLKYIIKQLVKSINPKFSFKKFDLHENEEAYNNFVSEFYQNII